MSLYPFYANEIKGTCQWQVFCAYVHLLKMQQDVQENIQ